ncbi:hypothetical protein KFK09_018762 [Dendrobium nobile]|uniref:Uncharacterized protein n=1 Tax=Dendrobium nobile TaxID=94219 RepID=A0A8T3AX25_DENNO|nr:hypothetical protein KFK09_018762 [Dendrobium nobile]
MVCLKSLCCYHQWLQPSTTLLLLFNKPDGTLYLNAAKAIEKLRKLSLKKHVSECRPYTSLVACTMFFYQCSLSPPLSWRVRSSDVVQRLIKMRHVIPKMYCA